MKYLSNILILVISLIVLSACQNGSRPAPDNFFSLKKVLVQGEQFLFTTYQRVDDKTKPYVFYIEGDGYAFGNGGQVTSNPTPISTFFVQLASMDTRPNVVYIARPCQYTPMELNPKCDRSYWSDKRLSDDSINAINDVINSINNGNKFSLVGYSGGGGVAILIAARNPLVKDIITIAGNLDIELFVKHHRATPMKASLNPIDYAKQINYIPQLHMSGGQDKTVPPFIAEEFTKRAGSNCVKQRAFPNNSHKEGWTELWQQQIYAQPLTCKE